MLEYRDQDTSRCRDDASINYIKCDFSLKCRCYSMAMYLFLPIKCHLK